MIHLASATKAAAGDRDVLVHGAYTAQKALEAGVLDELQIHQIPVVFSDGCRLFDILPSPIELEIDRVGSMVDREPWIIQPPAAT